MNDPDADPRFQIEPELVRSYPRKVIATGRTRFLQRLAWNGLLALYCLITFLANRELNDIALLSRHGRAINAYVFETRTDANDSADTSCTVAYTFRRGSVQPNGKFYIRNPDYRELHIGDPFHVTYLPDDPSVYRQETVGPELVDRRRVFWVSTAFVWSVPCLGFVWMVVRYYAARRRLLEHGLAEIATVVSESAMKPDDSSGYVLMTYAFTLSDRHLRHGQVTVTKSFLDAYPQGRKFSILVDKADRHRSQPYFAFTTYAIVDAPKRNFR